MCQWAVHHRQSPVDLKCTENFKTKFYIICIEHINDGHIMSRNKYGSKTKWRKFFKCLITELQPISQQRLVNEERKRSVSSGCVPCFSWTDKGMLNSIWVKASDIRIFMSPVFMMSHIKDTGFLLVDVSSALRWLWHSMSCIYRHAERSILSRHSEQ